MRTPSRDIRGFGVGFATDGQVRRSRCCDQAKVLRYGANIESSMLGTRTSFNQLIHLVGRHAVPLRPCVSIVPVVQGWISRNQFCIIVLSILRPA